MQHVDKKIAHEEHWQPSSTATTNKSEANQRCPSRVVNNHCHQRIDVMMMLLHNHCHWLSTIGDFWLTGH